MASYGHMRFRRALTEREQEIIDQNLGSIIEIDDWWMAEGQYNYEQFWRVFEVCEEITAKNIDLNQNERKEVIHDIIHIKFPNLTAINFSTNNIESISDLQFLDAPLLIYLTLTFNSIADFSSLSKCFFPNLKGLYVRYYNNAASLDWLPLLTTSATLDYLSLEYDQNDEPVIQEKFSVLFKLMAQSVKKIGMFVLIHNGRAGIRQERGRSRRCWAKNTPRSSWTKKQCDRAWLVISHHFQLKISWLAQRVIRNILLSVLSDWMALAGSFTPSQELKPLLCQSAFELQSSCLLFSPNSKASERLPTFFSRLQKPFPNRLYRYGMCHLNSHRPF